MFYIGRIRIRVNSNWICNPDFNPWFMQQWYWLIHNDLLLFHISLSYDEATRKIFALHVKKLLYTFIYILNQIFEIYLSVSRSISHPLNQSATQSFTKSSKYIWETHKHPFLKSAFPDFSIIGYKGVCIFQVVPSRSNTHISQPDARQVQEHF